METKQRKKVQQLIKEMNILLVNGMEGTLQFADLIVRVNELGYRVRRVNSQTVEAVLTA